MSHYIQQEFDFIDRTKQILEQYDKFQIAEKERFEVTLLLNCLVGLLILPQQHWFDKLPTELITVKDWGINPKHISEMKKGEIKSVKEIAKHLRNSVAHYNFKAFENNSKNISSINFKDFDKGKNDPNRIKTFEATIPISDLRCFLEKLTNTFTDKMTTTN